MRLPSHVPEHLRRYVVQQDYGQYTEQDQAVWRFVLLQLFSRLKETAHPAYVGGLEATGISVERIPRVEEMNERLSRFGWGAVSVDGFIPPRAFQEFQELALLPIASDIRTLEHLAYTPAPDIIHEAAGHAPILSDPAYARFLKKIGEVGRQAFATPADRAVYDAIHTLSEVKENPACTAEQLARAERALEEATTNTGAASEAARVARLYWWTVEYGLVGTPSDYRLYGAGLLSSLGESYSCHHARVKKLVLSADCIEVDYDITREQPQLFVARDFEHLEEVLETVAGRLAFRVGGSYALELARNSGEVATVDLDSGLALVGIVSDVHEREGDPIVLQLSGRTALAHEGGLLDLSPPNEYVLPLGSLEDGTPLSALTLDTLVTRYVDRSERLELRLGSGARVTGRLRGTRQQSGRLVVLIVEDFELTTPDGRLFRSRPPYPLALGHRVLTARAGGVAGYFRPTQASGSRVPKPRWMRATERELTALYARAMEAWRSLGGSELVAEFEEITAQLDDRFPEDWLLKWNLLESLVKIAKGEKIIGRLERDLENLEIRYEHRQPIATGLSYIRSLAKTSDCVPTAGGKDAP